MREAVAYENGRLLALEILRLRGRLPRWNVPDLFPAHLKHARQELVECAYVNDEAPTFMFPTSRTTLRPPHLLREDLRQELVSKGLQPMAPEREMEIY